MFKKYTGESGRKLKEKKKEHKDHGEKSREDKKITGLSQHMKITDHSPAWDDVRIIYREKNGKRESSKKHLKQHHIRKNNWWIKKMKER